MNVFASALFEVFPAGPGQMRRPDPGLLRLRDCAFHGATSAAIGVLEPTTGGYSLLGRRTLLTRKADTPYPEGGPSLPGRRAVLTRAADPPHSRKADPPYLWYRDLGFAVSKVADLPDEGRAYVEHVTTPDPLRERPGGSPTSSELAMACVSAHRAKRTNRSPARATKQHR